MKRLIDAEVLCNALRIMAGTGAEPDSCEDGYDRGIDVALRFVETAPTVDATPVIHAHWIFNRGRCSCLHCGGSRNVRCTTVRSAAQKWTGRG